MLLFVAVPTALSFLLPPRMLFPAIWLLAIISYLMLRRDPTIDRRQLWNAKPALAALPGMLLRFAGFAALLGGALAYFEPERLFVLPRTKPALWAIIMVGYPVLSVYAQEVAFRALFVHRYASVFRSDLAMVLACAAAFGYAHVIMNNPVAITFCAIGGVLFTRTYLQTRSLLAASIEHAIYGCWLFTVGWGWYFFAGAQRT